MTEVVRRRRIAAPPAAVWGALADFGAIVAWAPDVDHSCLLHGDSVAVGSARRIQIGRTTLVETIDSCEPGTTLGYRIEGLPPVIRSVCNRWELAPAGPGTDVTLTTTVDAGPRPPQQLVARLVARRLARASGAMLAGLAAHLVPTPPTASTASTASNAPAPPTAPTPDRTSHPVLDG